MALPPSEGDGARAVFVDGRFRADLSTLEGLPYVAVSLAAAAGGSKCSRANADQVREATGYPIGGVPPIGLATKVREFIDVDLMGYDTVWAAAGTWHDVFEIQPEALAAASGGWVGTLRRG